MKILFVCLGNICRSPSAEAVFRKKANEIHLNWTFDSAGTIGHHAGEASDPRSIRHAEQRGYEMTHLARALQKNDFEVFDLIFVMDHKNLADVLALAPEQAKNKVKLLRHYQSTMKQDIVPDPYYGQAKDFELVLDLIEDSWQDFIKKQGSGS